MTYNVFGGMLNLAQLYSTYITLSFSLSSTHSLKATMQSMQRVNMRFRIWGCRDSTALHE